jgi:ribosomal 50S subunit-associated protein YjgA (DUF615 family)
VVRPLAQADSDSAARTRTIDLIAIWCRDISAETIARQLDSFRKASAEPVAIDPKRI